MRPVDRLSRPRFQASAATPAPLEPVGPCFSESTTSGAMPFASSVRSESRAIGADRGSRSARWRPGHQPRAGTCSFQRSIRRVLPAVGSTMRSYRESDGDAQAGSSSIHRLTRFSIGAFSGLLAMRRSHRPSIRATAVHRLDLDIAGSRRVDADPRHVVVAATGLEPRLRGCCAVQNEIEPAGAPSALRTLST